MTQVEFAKKIGIGSVFWWQVLNGRRSLGPKNAKKVNKELGGKTELIWRGGGNVKERQRLWRKYARPGR